MGTELLSPAAAHAAGKTSGTTSASATEKQVVKGSAMSDETLPEAKPGSIPVLMAEVRYGIVFGEVNELFYGKLHRFLLFMSILCGSLAGAGLASQFKQMLPEYVGWISLVVGLVAAVAFAARQAFKFDQREAAFKKARMEFQELEGAGWSKNQGTLDREIKKIRKNAPPGGGWLAAYAYNKACRELGYPDHRMPIRGVARLVGDLVAA